MAKRDNEQEHTLQRGLERGWANVTCCSYPGCDRARRKDSQSEMCRDHMHSAYCRCRKCQSGFVREEPREKIQHAVPVKVVNLWTEGPDQRPQKCNITLPKEPWL